MCLATNPLPVNYKWTKDGDEVHDSDNVKVHNNILVVTPRQRKDFGVYVCHVSNIAGNATYEIELVQRDKMNVSCKYTGLVSLLSNKLRFRFVNYQKVTSSFNTDFLLLLWCLGEVPEYEILQN